MEIVLIRHGQPEWVRDGLNVVDPPLNERGHRQAEQMAQALAVESFDEIYCSPLDRARQTAAPLFGVHGRAETIDPWLEEIRDPIWHGTPEEKAIAAFNEEKARPSWDRWRGLDEFGGEHLGEFDARIRAGVTGFLADRGVVPVPGDLPVWTTPSETVMNSKIALVAHAGTNSVVICRLLGLAATPWEWERFVINHASITRLVALQLGDGITFALSRLSDVAHLADDDRTY
jgi:2,3-bisphosphoglycerate-dependent phosphoglycerate mutase